MTWLVFGVSCLLVLAGAISISTGAPYIQLERGWTEVISGTVAMSGGGVVFALGVILMRLEALRDAVAAGAVPAPLTNTFSPPPPTSIEPSTDRVAEAPADAPVEQVNPPATPVAATEPAVQPAEGGLWKRVRHAPAEPAPDVPPSAPAPFVAEPSRPDPGIAVAPADQDASTPPRVEPVRGASEEPGQLGWLERSLFRGRPTPQEDRGPGRPNERVEPALEGFERIAAAEPADTAPTLRTEMAHDEPAPAGPQDDDGPTEIGRYQAGVASYVMYSDGTIEVETEGGQSHRFGSMDELKAFIANQDKPAS